MRYSVRTPSPPLSRFVEHFWSLSDAPLHRRESIVPSGTVELVINLHADRFRIYVPGGDAECRCYSGAIVSGCYGTPFGIDSRDHADVIGVHFRPGGAAGLLGVPPGELANAHVDLEDLWGDGAAELRERLCAGAGLGERAQILENALMARLHPSHSLHRAASAALGRLDRQAAVGQVAEDVGLSRRRFIEIFTRDVGMTPKRYSRVRRFQRALTRVAQREFPGWAELAVECGYSDQAHLCRDWLELTGVSPTEFLALRTTEVKENHVAVR